MNQSPMVIVVMPMDNAEQYVAEAVTSILAQIFSAFELLIVDDGSTDRSLTTLQQLANQDPRLRLIIRPNTGYEDLDLWLRLGEVGQRANLRELVLRYRLHTKSVSEQNYARQRQNAPIACENAWERRGIEGSFEASERWRLGDDRVSRNYFMLQYSWWAFHSSQCQTAMLYGIKAIAALPFNLDGWKLLDYAALKPIPSC